LEENELQDQVEKVISRPEGEEEKSKYKKNEAKARIILVYSIKDHLIPHVVGLKTTKAIYDALGKLYAINNINKKLALKNNLHNIIMTK